ncbi:MAG: PTS sugar transporter subunit IIA [Calditrichaeota bacterium]|nr:MAG: PTS sugar transporter subunit IIA [Calditrichota bacterium]
MNLARYFREDLVKLEMTTVVEPLGEEQSESKWQQNIKENVLDELVTLLESGVRIGNRTKLLNDYIHRERKATTGIGHGIAIPHVRSMQAKEFSIAFARSSQGYYFDSLDNQPAHLFFIMAAPPYDDDFYLKVYKSLAEMLQYDSFREELLSMQTEGELMRVLRTME